MPNVSDNVHALREMHLNRISLKAFSFHSLNTWITGRHSQHNPLPGRICFTMMSLRLKQQSHDSVTLIMTPWAWKPALRSSNDSGPLVSLILVILEKQYFTNDGFLQDLEQESLQIHQLWWSQSAQCQLQSDLWIAAHSNNISRSPGTLAVLDWQLWNISTIQTRFWRVLDRMRMSLGH